MGIGITAQKYGSQRLQEARVMMMFCGYSIRAQKVNSNKLMLSVNAEVTPILPDLVFLLFGTSYVCWMYVSVCVRCVFFVYDSTCESSDTQKCYEYAHIHAQSVFYVHWISQ